MFGTKDNDKYKLKFKKIYIIQALLPLLKLLNHKHHSLTKQVKNKFILMLSLCLYVYQLFSKRPPKKLLSITNINISKWYHSFKIFWKIHKSKINPRKHILFSIFYRNNYIALHKKNLNCKCMILTVDCFTTSTSLYEQYLYF